MQINRGIERKTVKFVAELVVAVVIFCVWLANVVTKEEYRKH